jgi:hypothetical protein
MGQNRDHGLVSDDAHAQYILHQLAQELFLWLNKREVLLSVIPLGTNHLD